jgi:hypothetical protein
MSQERPAQFEFDRDTAVRDRGDGRSFDVHVDAGWTVGPKPNGGYLLAILARAAGAAVEAAGAEHPHPLGATAHYLRAPDAGPAEVEVEVLRLGRGASQARATLIQGGKACVDAVFTLGSLPTPDAAPQPWWTGPEPFPVAPYEDCVRMPAANPSTPGSRRRSDRSRIETVSSAPGGAAGIRTQSS